MNLDFSDLSVSSKMPHMCHMVCDILVLLPVLSRYYASATKSCFMVLEGLQYADTSSSDLELITPASTLLTPPRSLEVNKYSVEEESFSVSTYIIKCSKA